MMRLSQRPFPSRSAFLRTGAAAGAATAFAPFPARAQTLPKIRVAGVPYDVGASALYALDQGFFAKHGLDVNVTTLNGGPAIAAAVAGGSLEIGAANTASLAAAYENGTNFVLVGPSGAYTSKSPTGAIVVAQKSSFKSARDVIGKTVGVNLKSLGEVVTRAWMEQSGVSGDALKWVDMPISQVGAAIQQGRIDLGPLEEPFLSASLQNGGRILAYAWSAIAPTWCEGGFFSTLDWAQKNPQIIKRFGDAIAETHVWANANHEATAKILEKYARAPIPPHMARMYYPPRLIAAQIQPLIDASAKYGVLKYAFPAKSMFAPGVESS